MSNRYTEMQKSYYERETPNMKIVNHMNHNDNQDYWNILLEPLKTGNWSRKKALDFGCGCGRNVLNMSKTFNIG